jgi:hypothetical protein
VPFDLMKRPPTPQPTRAVPAPARRPGELAAMRLEAAALASSVALTHTTMLSAAEARAIQMAPLGEARYKAIADAFAAYAVTEIAMLAHQD